MNSAAINICQFQASPPHLQHALVESQGVFLLKKYSGKLTTLLYQVNDFYVELLYASTFSSKGIIRCLSVDEMSPYLNQIDLSVLHPHLKHHSG